MRRISLLYLLAVILLLSPGPSRVRAQQTDGPHHIVQPADTPLDLGLFYRVSLESLELDSIEFSEHTITSGQDIRIPRATVTQAALPPATAAAPQATIPTYHIVQQGDTLFRIATRYGVPLNALAAVNNLASPDHIFAGQQLTLPPPGTSSLDYPALSEAPAPNTGGPIPPPSLSILGGGKEIVVVLSTQRVYAYEDGALLREFVVSTGLPATPTVQGRFAIYIKLESQRMVGPDYDLPNVPWVMYFYQGYGLHGTYWHNNFGHPMSHGCVNMRTPEAEWLYYWAPMGTPVEVVY